MKKIYFITMLFFAYATAYTAVDIGKVDYFAHVEYPSSMLYAGESDGGFLWKNKNAHDLIEYLKCLHAKGRFSMMLYCYHFNWVQKSDIGYLMQQMDSTEECAGIVFAHESRIAGASTVGIEARRIIISFWAGYYPSNLKVDDIKRDAILAWYEVWYSAYGKKMHLQNPKLGWQKEMAKGVNPRDGKRGQSETCKQKVCHEIQAWKISRAWHAACEYNTKARSIM